VFLKKNELFQHAMTDRDEEFKEESLFAFLCVQGHVPFPSLHCSMFVYRAMQQKSISKVEFQQLVITNH